MTNPLDRAALPRLAVGTMNFGKRTPEAESARIVARALERGLTWFDTANVYNEGESEKILGRALGKDRASAIVATKVGAARIEGKGEGLRPERVIRALDECLGRLGMDHVDLYYLHTPDHGTPLGETLAGVAEVLRAGKARAWGMSNYSSWQVLDAMTLADARKMPRPIAAQQIYNAAIRQLDVEWFRFAAAHPIHTTTYNALAGGLFTGRHSRDAGPAKGSRFDRNGMYQRRYWNDAMFDFVEEMTAIAKEEGTSLMDLAYAFVSGAPGVDSVLLGPATVEQLDAGADGCARVLSEAARGKLGELYRAHQGTDATYAR
jgi:aryl-alcohol dehydrogenase-like predicted oxidoreductase